MPPKKGEARGHWKVRITLQDGTRPWFHLDPSWTEQRARAKGREWSDRARREGIVWGGPAPVPRATSASRATAEASSDWCRHDLEPVRL
jgi:hypothetical protein